MSKVSRSRYRERGALQDTVEITIKVPAAMLDWLERESRYSIYGVSVEGIVCMLLTMKASDVQEARIRTR